MTSHGKKKQHPRIQFGRVRSPYVQHEAHSAPTGQAPESILKIAESISNLGEKNCNAFTNRYFYPTLGGTVVPLHEIHSGYRIKCSVGINSLFQDVSELTVWLTLVWNDSGSMMRQISGGDRGGNGQPVIRAQSIYEEAISSNRQSSLEIVHISCEQAGGTQTIR